MKTLMFIVAIALTVSSEILSEEIKFEPMLETYKEGDNLTLTCVRTPDNVCEWTRSGRKVHLELESRYHPGDNNCGFTISPVRAEDDGRWRCLVSPINSSSSSQSVTLSRRLIVDDVNFIHGAHFLTSTVQVLTYVEAEAGSRAELRCHFNASAPACFWTFNGDVIAIRGRYQYKGDKHDGDCSIEIHNADHRDNGQWQCCYPKMDTWPITKSPNIVLNVTVTPKDPVISVQGIGMDEGSHIYVSTTTNRQHQARYTTSLDSIRMACWSENGNPAAALSWGMEDSDGDPVEFSEMSQNTRWNVKGQPQLEVRCNRFQGLQQRMSTVSSLRLLKLKCNAHHPNYNNRTKSTFVWLTWDDTITSNYYG